MLSINRGLWISNQLKNYPCPYCNIGILVSDNKYYVEKECNIDFNIAYFPFLVEYSFSVILFCNNCCESISLCGIKEITKQFNHDDNEIYIETKYRIKGTSYPLNIFNIPFECPDEIKKIVKESFSLFWINLESCANKVRVAIELILDEKSFGNCGKMLHEKISQFSKMNKINGKYMMAIKKIGNKGSHGDEIFHETILDAYELLYNIIEDMYINPIDRLNDISKKYLNDKK